ncbi:hypothetical protein GUJ93_ZPchr0011g27697 [Zizania palustris]|uniref:Uncharacterized protein n=1 Tax=Zizania palustris TaxID=103762 RepID=A0A8J6BKR8_ZIZPA|nr:hypothetical protein GUJ93_ZPchr0011g27697 [Zizania palustris]
MARSSSSSSSMGTLGSLGEESPILYRHGPLDYLPSTICYCGNKATRWISWSEANPGQRYFTCYHRRYATPPSALRADDLGNEMPSGDLTMR